MALVVCTNELNFCSPLVKQIICVIDAESDLPASMSTFPWVPSPLCLSPFCFTLIKKASMTFGPGK
jgi:hypothetical protein